MWLWRRKECTLHTHTRTSHSYNIIIILYRQMRAILCLILFHFTVFITELLLVIFSAIMRPAQKHNCYYSTLAHLIPRACATIQQICVFFHSVCFFCRSFVFLFISFYLFRSVKFALKHFDKQGECNNKSVRIYNVRRQYMCSCNCVHLIGLSISCSLLFFL